VRLQCSPLAGFQYHAGPAVWPLLSVGAPLALVREPANPWDERAVRVEWRGHKLGYVPRAENTAVASLLDQGYRVEGRIAALRESADPWERVEMELFFDPGGGRALSVASAPPVPDA
jgi:hypothetical protein